MKDKQKLKDKLKEALDSLNTIRSEEWYVTLTKEEIEYLLNCDDIEYLELEVNRLRLKQENFSEIIEDRDLWKSKYEELIANIKTPSQDPREN